METTNDDQLDQAFRSWLELDKVGY